jgi:hypothetical protein
MRWKDSGYALKHSSEVERGQATEYCRQYCRQYSRRPGSLPEMTYAAGAASLVITVPRLLFSHHSTQDQSRLRWILVQVATDIVNRTGQRFDNVPSVEGQTLTDDGVSRAAGHNRSEMALLAGREGSRAPAVCD